MIQRLIQQKRILKDIWKKFMSLNHKIKIYNYNYNNIELNRQKELIKVKLE